MPIEVHISICEKFRLELHFFFEQIPGSSPEEPLFLGIPRIISWKISRKNLGEIPKHVGNCDSIPVYFL